MPTPWRAGSRIVLLILGGVCAGLLSVRPAAQGVDLVYVRCPHGGRFPEVFRPTAVEPGCDLVLKRSTGTKEILVAGGVGAVTDPYVTFDGLSVLYAFTPDARGMDDGNKWRPAGGFDIYRVTIATKAITRLTFQEFTPNAAHGTSPRAVINLGPAPIAGNRIVFTSDRNGFAPTKPFTTTTLQLFVMDADGSNVHAIAPMTLGSALHPTPLVDGRIMFSSYESQGLRDWKLWGLWSIWPDGRSWGPLLSAFRQGQAFHFQTQLSNGDLSVVDYYNLNNGGFGTLYRFPTRVPPPSFFSAFAADNPPLGEVNSLGQAYTYTIPFSPKGIVGLTPWSSGIDDAAFNGVGKVTQPAGFPNGDCAVSYAAGSANLRTGGIADTGIYLIPGCQPTSGPQAFVRIEDDPAFNEFYPRAVVPYRAIYGVDEPVNLPWLPNDGTLEASLPAGTPYGIVGTSTVYGRESAPGDGPEEFNTYYPQTFTGRFAANWGNQGSDVIGYTNADIASLRIVTLEATSATVSPWSAVGENFWFNHAIERMRILGEIPLRKASGVLDREGNPDTSFWARIPADVPFTFQLLDRNGMVVTMAPTWHQVRPGEVRTDCGGCHYHSHAPVDFATTAAASTPPVDLTQTQPTSVEFLRDVRPILQAKCVSCHRGTTPAGNLAFDDLALVRMTAFAFPKGTWPADYLRLAADVDARWGTPPPSGTTWKSTNASRYVRMFQSRRSLLIWKAYNRRLDGLTNASRADDLDYTTDHPTTLTDPERKTLATWIDTGASITGGGLFVDETRPTLTISQPRVNGPLSAIRVGLADVGAGLDLASLSITATIPLGGQPAGANLLSLATPLTDGVLLVPVLADAPGSLTVTILDRAKNRTTQTVTFRAGTSAPPPPDPEPDPDPPPPPPPSDPCVLAPLTFSVSSWPNPNPGSRQLRYQWSGTGPLTVTFTSTTAVASNPAGCAVTVTK